MKTSAQYKDGSPVLIGDRLVIGQGVCTILREVAPNYMLAVSIEGIQLDGGHGVFADAFRSISPPERK